MDPAWVTAIAAIATTLAGAGIWTGRRAWRVMAGISRFLDEWRGTEGRPGVMARLAALEEGQQHIIRETRSDGGRSLRDVAVRTAQDVAEIKAEQARMRQRMELLEAQRAAREEGKQGR